MGALAANRANETKWTILTGSTKGSVRLMNLPKFIVGRSPDCQFVIVNDPKCSRRHAVVEMTLEGFEIEAIGEGNPLRVNGQAIQRAQLADGDVVSFGDTDVQFNLTSSQTFAGRERSISIADQQTRISILPAASQAVVPEIGWSDPSPQKSKRKPKAPNNPVRTALYVIIGLVVLLILLPNSKKKEEVALRTEKQIQADIEAANKLNEAAQNLPIKRFDQTVSSRQAQENFVRGFRDYRKGQFERSLDSFQACLALDPNHVLCNRYIRLAQRRFNELVQYNMVLGRKYRDQNQFQACRAAFRNVMVMVKDANSLSYKEAKANYDACNSFVEGRY